MSDNIASLLILGALATIVFVVVVISNLKNLYTKYEKLAESNRARRSEQQQLTRRVQRIVDLLAEGNPTIGDKLLRTEIIESRGPFSDSVCLNEAQIERVLNVLKRKE